MPPLAYCHMTACQLNVRLLAIPIETLLLEKV